MKKLHIVFDGPPGPESGRFVEVEDAEGHGQSVGDWEQHGDFWHLVIDDPRDSDRNRRKLAAFEALMAMVRQLHCQYCNVPLGSDIAEYDVTCCKECESTRAAFKAAEEAK